MRRVLILVGGLFALGIGACEQPSGIAGCNPGTSGCECIAAACHGNLTCVSGICVDAGGMDAGTDSGETGDDPTGGDGGICNEPESIPAYPAQACLPDVPCANDGNCPDGHVCNTELDPPACQLLYCGTEGSICHVDEVCDEGFQCHEGQCNPCDVCGDLCEVDFDTDPNHCGCCDSPVPSGGVCQNGVAQCPGELSLCDGACVNLESNPDNCGTCGNQVGPGVICVDGAPSCPEAGFPLLLCDGTCVDFLYDENNCGECGATCPAGDCAYPGIIGSTHTYCYVEIEPDPNTTCTIACAELGMGCDSGSYQEAVYDGWCDTVEYAFECSETVPTSVSCDDGLCACELIARGCRCHPVPP